MVYRTKLNVVAYYEKINITEHNTAKSPIKDHRRQTPTCCIIPVYFRIEMPTPL